MAGVVENVSWRAFTLVSARGVNADAIEAHVRSQLLALVYILAHLILRIISHSRRTNTLKYSIQLFKKI